MQIVDLNNRMRIQSVCCALVYLTHENTIAYTNKHGKVVLHPHSSQQVQMAFSCYYGIMQFI